MNEANQKFSFSRATLRIQLVLLVSTIVVVATVIFMLFTMYIQRQFFIEEFDNATLATIESARLGLEIGLKEENFESINTVVSWVKENDNVRFIALADEDGFLLATYPDNLSYTVDEIQSFGSIISYSDTLFVREEEWTSSIGGDGALFIGFSTKYLLELEQENIWNLAFIISIVLSGAVITSFFMAKGITRPLEQLRIVAKKISNNNLETRANNNAGSPEIRSVAVSFNTMVDKLMDTQKQRISEMETFNMSLEERNQKIEEINTKLIDSITYSIHIQQSILPGESLLNTEHYESFQLFRPKDIVSGDLYWFTEKDGKYYWAVVDCTGHGVPGSFMTVVGGTLLNNIIKSGKYTSAAEVLEILDDSVRDFLRQDEEETATRDGMDMSLIIFDPVEQKFTYSGARRHLIYIDQNGELQEIKSVRRSVGGKKIKTDRLFEDHHLDNMHDTMLYLTTDGFADQFSDTNEKFGSLRLKSIFAQIYRSPLDQQKNELTDILETHMGTEPQIDDITIVGINIRKTQPL